MDIRGSYPSGTAPIGSTKMKLLHLNYEAEAGVRLRALGTVLPVHPSLGPPFALSLFWVFNGVCKSFTPLVWQAFLSERKFRLMHRLLLTHEVSGLDHAIAEETLLDALIHGWLQANDSQFCLNLSTLKFTNVNFGCQNSSLVSNLKHLFRQESSKVPLNRLVVKSCSGFTRKDAVELSQLDPSRTLIWDGQEEWT